MLYFEPDVLRKEKNMELLAGLPGLVLGLVFVFLRRKHALAGFSENYKMYSLDDLLTAVFLTVMACTLLITSALYFINSYQLGTACVASFITCAMVFRLDAWLLERRKIVE